MPTLDLVEIAAASGVDVAPARRGLLRARRAARAPLAARPDRRLPRDTRWEAMARAALRDDVYAEQAALTAEVVRAGPNGQPARARDRVVAGAERRRDRALAPGARRHPRRRRARPRPAVGRGAQPDRLRTPPDPLEPESPLPAADRSGPPATARALALEGVAGGWVAAVEAGSEPLDPLLAGPCVKDSGLTRWPACSWIRSSPTAEAALRPSSRSPDSSRSCL